MRRGIAGHATAGGVAVRVVGPFSVEAEDGRRLAGSTGGIGGKARTVLMLLAAERGRGVPVERIVEVLWAGDPPRRAVENVATLVSRLRRVLGPAAISGGRAGYRLAGPPAVTVDVDVAAALVAEAERWLAGSEPALAMAAATRALGALDDGSVLEEARGADWAERLLAEVTDLLRRARHAAAAAALGTGASAHAARVAWLAVTADAFDEPAHRLLMRAHAAAGEPARALQVYERLRGVLAEELGVDPAPQTQALYLAILRADGPPTVVAPQPVGARRRTGSGASGLPARPLAATAAERAAPRGGEG